ncbi:MAG: hypothetical protein ACJA1P_000604, partial [Maribacter sp.]
FIYFAGFYSFKKEIAIIKPGNTISVRSTQIANNWIIRYCIEYLD